jgi:hypothetical protein
MVATRTYDENSDKTFNRYFEMILRRRFSRLISTERKYLNNVELIEDEHTICEPDVFVYRFENNSNEEYLSKLHLVNSINTPTIAMLLPSTETIYEIDL